MLKNHYNCLNTRSYDSFQLSCWIFFMMMFRDTLQYSSPAKVCCYWLFDFRGDGENINSIDLNGIVCVLVTTVCYSMS